MSSLHDFLNRANGFGEQVGASASPNVLDIVAEELRKEYPALSMDEGRIIAYAYTHREGKSPSLVGCQRTPPDGYLDSTVGFGFLDRQESMQTYCKSLVAEGHLVAHSTATEMVRISEKTAKECARIFKNIK